MAPAQPAFALPTYAELASIWRNSDEDRERLAHAVVFDVRPDLGKREAVDVQLFRWVVARCHYAVFDDVADLCVDVLVAGR